MIKFLMSLFGGGIPDQLRRAYEAKLNAQNDADRIAAEIEIVRIEARQASHSIGGRWITFLQVAFAFPFVVYNAKLILWDKVLGWGITDPLSPQLYELQATVLAFVFVTSTVRVVTGR